MSPPSAYRQCPRPETLTPTGRQWESQHIALNSTYFPVWQKVNRASSEADHERTELEDQKVNAH